MSSAVFMVVMCLFSGGGGGGGGSSHNIQSFFGWPPCVGPLRLIGLCGLGIAW